jgi:hypothetical protein
MGDRSGWPSIKRSAPQQGIFVTATVTVLVLVAALVMTRAYHSALADWQTVGKSAKRVSESGE